MPSLCGSGFTGSAESHVDAHNHELEAYIAGAAERRKAEALAAETVRTSEREQRRLYAVKDLESGEFTENEVAETHGVAVATLK